MIFGFSSSGPEKGGMKKQPENASMKLAVGMIAPDFSLTEVTRNQEITPAQFRGRNLLLVFLRGTWCPFCRQQLQLLVENFTRLQEANVEVVAVVCQSRTTVTAFLKEHPLPFPLLPDETRAVAKRYGVHYWISLEGFNLANPALFILDTSGTILFVHIGRNMTDLPVGFLLEKFLLFLGLGASSDDTSRVQTAS